jgi:branched-subunit amino acid aminotransferase/4-amino-4-deoxychorismate lyase
LSASDVLSALPRAAYTTARANAQRRVFDFSSHVSRTAASAAAMAASEAHARGVGAAGSAETLRPLLGASMALAMRALDAASGKRAEGIKITSLVLWGVDRCKNAAEILMPSLSSIAEFDPRAAVDRDSARAWSRRANVPLPSSRVALDIDLAAATAFIADSCTEDEPLLITHVCELSPRRPPPVRALVAGSPRKSAAAKDTEWVRARTALEARQGSDFEEVLLSAEGCLYEGLQTNFFALNSESVLETAPDGAVLSGTVRGLVLSQAEKAGIRVSFTAPRLSDAAQWRGAFICSTSRLVMPLDALTWRADDVMHAGIKDATVSFPRDPAVARIEALVSAAVDEQSEDVCGEDEMDAAESVSESAVPQDWRGEARKAVSEVRGGVASADVLDSSALSSSAAIRVETLEGVVCTVTLSSDGATLDDGAAYDSLHSVLLAKSARYRDFFHQRLCEKLGQL